MTKKLLLAVTIFILRQGMIFHKDLASMLGAECIPKKTSTYVSVYCTDQNIMLRGDPMKLKFKDFEMQK